MNNNNIKRITRNKKKDTFKEGEEMSQSNSNKALDENAISLILFK